MTGAAGFRVFWIDVKQGRDGRGELTGKPGDFHRIPDQASRLSTGPAATLVTFHQTAVRGSGRGGHGLDGFQSIRVEGFRKMITHKRMALFFPVSGIGSDDLQSLRCDGDDTPSKSLIGARGILESVF